MESIYVTALVISVVYLIAKFLEMRIVEKESRPLKILIKDSLIVYFSILFGHFVIQQVAPVVKKSVQFTPAFLDNPGF